MGKSDTDENLHNNIPYFDDDKDSDFDDDEDSDFDDDEDSDFEENNERLCPQCGEYPAKYRTDGDDLCEECHEQYVDGYKLRD